MSKPEPCLWCSSTNNKHRSWCAESSMAETPLTTLREELDLEGLRVLDYLSAYANANGFEECYQILIKFEKAIQAKLDRVRVEAYELLYWKYKELNGQSVDMKFVEAYNVLKAEAAQSSKEGEQKS